MESEDLMDQIGPGKWFRTITFDVNIVKEANSTEARNKLPFLAFKSHNLKEMKV